MRPTPSRRPPDPDFLAPGATRRFESLVASEFTMTAVHLARTMQSARERERRRIAVYIEERADVAAGEGLLDVADRLRVLAEDIRTDAPTLSVAGFTETEAISVPVTQEATGELPPVHHLDDFEEGTALVRNLGARGKLNL